jgi:Mg-chelatase subunit ChlI
MAEGSVIEVATWRGTGRPDSRTSRLMLGMSPGNLSDDASETTGYAGGQKEKKPEGFAKYLDIANKALKTIAKLIMKLPVGKLKNVKLGKINLPKRGPKQIKPTSMDSGSPATPTTSATSTPSFTSSTSKSSKESKSDSNEDVDDWLAQIIKKAESNSKSEAKSKISANTPAKSAPQKKKAAAKPKKSTKTKK